MSQETTGKKIALFGAKFAAIVAIATGGSYILMNVFEIKIDSKMFGVISIISLAIFLIFVLSLVIAKKNETFIPRFPSDPKWDEDFNLAVSEMTSNAVPCSTVEHQKGLVDWSPTFNSEQDLSKDPAMFVRQKKLLRPVGDIEKRLVASQRHCGKDGRSDQKPRS